MNQQVQVKVQHYENMEGKLLLCISVEFNDHNDLL
jgi:hypothetical protein